MKILIEIAGWLGSGMILTAYALIATRKINSRTRIYQVLNIVGSLLLFSNTLYYRAIPPAALNMVWMGIGVFSLIRSRSHERHGG